MSKKDSFTHRWDGKPTATGSERCSRCGMLRILIGNYARNGITMKRYGYRERTSTKGFRYVTAGILGDKTPSCPGVMKDFTKAES